MVKPEQKDQLKSLDKTRLRVAYLTHLSAYETTLQNLQQKVRRILERRGLTPTIKYRVKRFEPYFDKVRKSATAEQQPISDFFGLRIICPFLEDIDVIEAVLRENCPVRDSERKGTQHSFREFGYDSVHLQVDLPSEWINVLLPGTQASCEIQLRTILQDAWAEVEHELVYKSDIDLPNESIRRKLASLNATLTLSDLIFQEIRDFQQEIRHRGRKRRESLHRVNAYETESVAEPVPSANLNTMRFSPLPKSQTSELESLMLQALDAHSNQDLETAIILYSRLLGLKQERKIRSLIYNHRGMAYFARGETRLALKDFCKAIHYEPESIRGHVNRGLCHRVLKQYEQAIADYSKVLEIVGDHEESFYGRAQCFYEMGLYDQALNDCLALLKRSPGDPSAKHLRELIQRAML